ncbi:MAG: hypothetical protein INR71_12995 [Terriglobus roseus]|nr:hypothetical protein [Terriglobus roseus]
MAKGEVDQGAKTFMGMPVRETPVFLLCTSLPAAAGIDTIDLACSIDRPRAAASSGSFVSALERALWPLAACAAECWEKSFPP